jgi:hypothetical protein
LLKLKVIVGGGGGGGTKKKFKELKKRDKTLTKPEPKKNYKK